ncbi:HNH endonuclease [Rhizobium leguminosarum]
MKIEETTDKPVKLSKRQRWKLKRVGQAEHVRNMRAEALKKAEQESLAKAGPPKCSHIPSKQEKHEFYKSWKWRAARVKVLQHFSASCQLCGASSKHFDMTGDPVRIVVDHIYPLHTHWHMRLDASNLQVLCDECNQGKGAWNTADFRYTDAELPSSLMEQLQPRG